MLTFGRQKPVYRLCANFPTAPEVDIPSARYVNAHARSRYTDGTVYQHQPPEGGIQTLFANAYCHRNAQVIEIQTRQKFSMTYSEFLWTNFAFEHLAANVRVRCSDFSKLRVYAVYSNRHPPSLFGEHCEILRWRTLRKTLKSWWGRLETRDGDETGDKTAATAGDERDGGDRWGNVCGQRSVYNRRPPCWRDGGDD